MDIWSFKTMLTLYQNKCNASVIVHNYDSCFVSCVDHIFNSDWAEGYCVVVLNLFLGYLIKLKNTSAIARGDSTPEALFQQDLQMIIGGNPRL